MTETMIADAALISPQIIAVSNVVSSLQLKRSDRSRPMLVVRLRIKATNNAVNVCFKLSVDFVKFKQVLSTVVGVPKCSEL